MNNFKFDPNTGALIQENTENTDTTTILENKIEEPKPEVVETAEPASELTVNSMDEHNLKNIPTVEQSKNDFINKMQAQTENKKENDGAEINFAFIIILFVIVLVAIYFLFPLLMDYI